MFHTDEIKNGS